MVSVVPFRAHDIRHVLASIETPTFNFGRSRNHRRQRLPAGFRPSLKTLHHPHRFLALIQRDENLAPNAPQDGEVDDLGVKLALSMLRFYKSEISPLLPRSCRYVPSCSGYSQEAYKKYGFVKGTVLTAWRICRCNPLGGSGYDPPRWFGEAHPPSDE